MNEMNFIVNKTYNNLIDVAKLDLNISGGYITVINNQNIDIEILLNKLFNKLINEINNKQKNILKIEYKSFTYNNPSNNLINDCKNLIISNKKSSNNTTLYELITQLEQKYTKDDLKNIIDIIFDILLDCYL